jgi:hypothetical protein
MLPEAGRRSAWGFGSWRCTAGVRRSYSVFALALCGLGVLGGQRSRRADRSRRSGSPDADTEMASGAPKSQPSRRIRRRPSRARSPRVRGEDIPSGTGDFFDAHRVSRRRERKRRPGERAHLAPCRAGRRLDRGRALRLVAVRLARNRDSPRGILLRLSDRRLPRGRLSAPRQAGAASTSLRRVRSGIPPPLPRERRAPAVERRRAHVDRTRRPQCGLPARDWSLRSAKWKARERSS